MKSLIFPLIASVGFSIVAADCSHNNCLRAVIASSNPKISGLVDCNSYLQATFTPATSTIYETVTATTYPTASFLVTDTTTISLTATTQEGYTATETNTASVTATIIAEKRQATEIPSNIPAYASPCSGAVKYSSACSCIGATGKTITAATPTTTVVVSETSTISVSTYITVATDTTFTTASTETESTAIATATVTETVAVATTTATPSRSFRINVTSGGYLPDYPWVGGNQGGGSLGFWIKSPNPYPGYPPENWYFKISATGQLVNLSGLGAYYKPSGTDVAYVDTMTAEAAAAGGWIPFLARIATEDQIVANQAVYDRIGACNGRFMTWSSSSAANAGCSGGNAITAKALYLES